MSQTYHFDPLPVDRLKINLSGGRIPTEHEEQRAFVEWFRKSGDVRIFAIPNGGARGAAQAGKLKAEGVSAGVPDLFIPEWMTWVEFKRRKGGTLDAKQKDWHQYLESIGHTVIVPKGCHEAVDMIRLCYENCNRDTP